MAPPSDDRLWRDPRERDRSGRLPRQQARRGPSEGPRRRGAARAGRTEEDEDADDGVGAPAAPPGGRLHHVSTHGRFFFPLRTGGGNARRALAIRARVSAGSITSSISNTEATLSAFPCS